MRKQDIRARRPSLEERRQRARAQVRSADKDRAQGMYQEARFVTVGVAQEDPVASQS